MPKNHLNLLRSALFKQHGSVGLSERWYICILTRMITIIQRVAFKL